jgi:hypothetical protein
VTDPSWASRSRLVVETGDPISQKPFTPQSHLMLIHADTQTNLT